MKKVLSISLVAFAVLLTASPFNESLPPRITPESVFAGTAEAKYTIDATQNAIRVSLLVGQYHSARPYTYYPTRDGIHTEDPRRVFVPNNARMQDVVQLDLKASTEWKIGSDAWERVVLTVDIRNLLNVRNILWMDANGRPGGELGDPAAYDAPRRV